jgi:dihydropteroate synthase
MRGIISERILRFPGGNTLAVGGMNRPRIMGILNVTPDSFSDGGRYSQVESAVARAEAMLEQGADIIDIGGESTRPGSAPVSVVEQIRRTVPVIEAIRRNSDVVVSIDTTLSGVARAALDAGAQIINDISALRHDPALVGVAAEAGAPLVLMHMLGEPGMMQANPVYGNVVKDVAEFLVERIASAVAGGVPRDQILVDPGFGFGKTLDHNLTLLRHLDAFAQLDAPVLVGASRKSMIGMVLDVPPAEREFGTAATTAAAIERGAAVIRVHDIRSTVHVAKMTMAILGKPWN